jgi:hypothetical protein
MGAGAALLGRGRRSLGLVAVLVVAEDRTWDLEVDGFP